MATPIFLSTISLSLQDTLEAINDDDTDGVESSADFPKYCDVETMDKAYEDILEMGGPGLASEVDEGTELPTAGIDEGFVTRYIARKFGIRMIVSEEAMEDARYPEALRLAQRMKRAMWKTADIDAANMYNRMFNSDYVGGDGVPLSSTSHTLPGGGTWSNQAATAFSPSRAALIVYAAQAREYPGHDGVREGYKLTGIDCPHNQTEVWQGIIGSPKVPESNNNEINVVKDMGLKLTPIVQWTASTTNYALRTNASGGGLKFKWRRRPRARSWVDNSQEFMNHSNSARWARGWDDARGHLCVNA
jgi:hypothetical protein